MQNLIIVFALLFIMACGNGYVATQGATGPTGPQGPMGSGCTVTTVSVSTIAPNGGSMIACGNGTGSLILNGSNGSPGTVVAPVQFCPGTTTYPSTFSEIGFCINGNIYAVYSANDGFLTEVVPGYYSSDGINSSCNFTVGANCLITY